MVFWAVLGVAKTAVGLGGAARFAVGVFGAATTTAAAPAAAATMLASRLAQILFTVAGSAVTAVAAKLQQRRRNSLPPPEPRKTANGSPVTTPEHSPATQLRLGKWVDGLKDNAKVKLGESAYKVSPFSQARLSI